MVYNASSVAAERDFQDKYFFVREQFKWISLGILAMVCFSLLPLSIIYKLSLPVLLISILGLLLLFVPGLAVESYGARRWLNITFFVRQPSELVKLGLTCYLASWLKNKRKNQFWLFLFLLLFVSALVMMQPDMGTTSIIVFLSFGLYFLAKTPLKHFLILLPLSFLAMIMLIKMAPYRYERLLSFLNFNYDPLGASYHIRQVLYGLASGGLWGLGIGQSRQKYAFLPEATTDSIFAIMAEEVGLIGSTLLLIAYLVLFWKIYKIILRTTNNFSRLLVSGVLLWLGSQTLLNLGAQVVLVPFTGLPLPFISYGGSAILTELAGIGIVLNVSRFLKRSQIR